MLNSKKFLDNFKPENMKLRDIDFSELSDCISTSNKGEKVMNNLVIKPDKYTIYQISKDDILELKHIPEHEVWGFSYLVSPRSCETFTPKWYLKEEWYVILKGGKRVDLTKKQYNVIKRWF